MKLIFIHGRDQQQRSLPEIRTEWTSGLSIGLKREKLPPLSNFLSLDYDLLVPYYGDVLDDLTKGIATSIFSAISKGPGSPPADRSVDELAAELAAEIALAIELQPDAEDVQMAAAIAKSDPTQWAPVQAFARAWDKWWPGLTDYVFSHTFLRDVAAYNHKRHVTHKVNEIVASALRTTEPCVVIAHSLGTVVAFRILNELFEKEKFTPDIRLLITAGSPLGITAVKRSFLAPLRYPPGVAEGCWYNVYDPLDIVALERELDDKSFVDGIANHRVTNAGGNPHRIGCYLEHTLVVRELYHTWTGKPR